MMQCGRVALMRSARVGHHIATCMTRVMTLPGRTGAIREYEQNRRTSSSKFMVHAADAVEVRERTRDAPLWASFAKHRAHEIAVMILCPDQTRRSRKVVEDADTSVTTITVESETAVTEKATVIKTTEEKSVSSVAETVLKHETVHEVADDSTCSTRSRRVPDRRTLLTS